MKTIPQKIQDWTAAITFAEAGEFQTAIGFVGYQQAVKRARKGVFESLRRAFVAVAFAEEGLHREAQELLAPRTARALTFESPRSFLEAVGLENAQVHYMIVRV